MAKRKAARRTRRTARKATGASRKRAAARKTSGRRRTAKKAAKKSRPVARKAVALKIRARKAGGAKAAGAITARKASKKAVARKAPALDRARRTVQGDDIVLATPPSSLDLNRTASAARSGRRAIAERLSEHNETSPALTAGDVDADWESAATVGDEAPGGDNPTPDQDIVDDIGKAVGVQYEDNEELKGEAKIAKRDKHRWELDPASAEDYKEHNKE